MKRDPLWVEDIRQIERMKWMEASGELLARGDGWRSRSEQFLAALFRDHRNRGGERDEQ